MKLLLKLIILSIIIGLCKSFTPSKNTLFFEDFQQLSKENRWIKSSHSDYSGIIEFKSSNEIVDENDTAMVFTELAKKYAITSKLSKPINNKDKDLIIQYEVQFQDGISCGGSYVKLYTDREDFSPESVKSDTPYSIMFGPDVCNPNNRIHFIVRHQNPITKEYEEKLITAKPPVRTDKTSHVYTLHIRPDNTFSILVDGESVLDASFHDAFTPAFNPPKEIDDPSDSKPSDWVDLKQIPDPSATKPEDWDETVPQLIPDPDEKQPEEWNTEDDGEWEAPLINNPEYKGIWEAPLIDNPAYKGEWKPKQIENPNYYQVENPYIIDPIIAIGVEIWTMSKDILFDNFIITHDKAEADKVLEELWKPKHSIQLERQVAREAEDAKNLEQQSDLFSNVMDYFNLFKASADENPMLYVVAFSSIILPFVFCLFKPSKVNQLSKDKPSTPLPEPSSSSSSKTTVKEDKPVKEVPSIESESSSSEDEKTTTKRRTTKVK